MKKDAFVGLDLNKKMENANHSRNALLIVHMLLILMIVFAGMVTKAKEMFVFLFAHKTEFGTIMEIAF